jgi:MFS family permease
MGNLSSVGLILSMYGLVQLVFRIPLGLFSDITGNIKVFIIIGFLFMGAGSLILGYGNSLGILMTGRALTGFGAATWVLLVSVFTRLFPVKRIVSATALITIANGIGKALSTFLTGFLNEWGGDSLVFIVASSSSAVAVILFLSAKIEKNQPAKFSFYEITQLFKRQEIIVSTIGHGVAMVGLWAITLSFLPVKAEILGAGDVEIGLILSLHLAAFTLSNYVNSRLKSTVTIQKRVFLATLVFSLGNLLAVIAPSTFWLYLIGIISGLGFGFLQSSFIGLSILKVDISQRSTALGFHQSLYSLGIFIGPWIGGVLADWFGLQVMFGIVSVFCLISLLVVTRFIDS